MWQCVVTNGDPVREAEVPVTQRVRARLARGNLSNPPVVNPVASVLTKRGVSEAGKVPTALPECTVGPQRLRWWEVAGAGGSAARR